MAWMKGAAGFGRTVRRGLILLPFVILPLAVPVDGAAQDGPPRQGQQMTRQEAQARVMQQFERRMARELRLDRGKLEEVQKVLHSMLEERRGLFQRRRALHVRIRRFQEEGGNETTAREILSESRAIRAAEARIESEEEARLLEVLTPAQVLRFQIMRDELNEQIRRMQRGPADTARYPGERNRAPVPGAPKG
jgi:hypothetical protein